jgi:hypothetical protein
MQFQPKKIGAGLVGIALTLAAAGSAAAQDEPETLGVCTPDATHLCFHGNRFSAAMTYQTPGGTVIATAMQPAGGKPGFFQFDDLLVAELWMDVLDACSINGFYWVTFLGVGQGWQLRVDDTLTGSWKSYTVPVGSFGPPVTQTDSFACPPAAEEPAAPKVATLQLGTEMDIGAEMDLGDSGRFRVRASRPTEVATGNQLTRDSGLLSFFTPSEPNILIKMVEPGVTPDFIGLVACSNQTDVTVEVTDRCTGTVRTYFRANPTTFSDGDAFLADDSLCGIFADGFESGDTTAWELTEP